MDIPGIVQDERKKKILIIVGVAFFIIGGIVAFFLTRDSSSATPEDNQQQLIEDFAKLAPRSGTSTSAFNKLPTIKLSADNTTIPPGQSSKISWRTADATECIDNTGESLPLTGSTIVSPKETYTFDILCTGPNGSDLQSVTISVTTAPIIRISATPNAVFAGKTSTVYWDTVNADRCIDSAGKTLRLSGNFSIEPTKPYTFSMSCSGPRGTTKKSITVRILKAVVADAPSKDTNDDGSTDTTIGSTTGDTTPDTGSTTPVVELTASPATVAYNEGTTLSWTLKNVTYCVFTSDGSIGGLPPFTYLTGTRDTPKLTATQTYTLSCTKGASKIDKSVTVVVGDKPIPPAPGFEYFKANNKIDNVAVATLDTIKFTWKTTSAKTCALKKDGKVVENKQNLGPSSNTTLYEKVPGEFTYTLACTGEGGDITSNPITVTAINCRFKNGFGGTLEEIDKLMSGTVESGSKYGRSEPAVCTYTYSSMAPFGFPREVRAGDEKYLCPFTRYYLIKTPSGTQSVNRFDKTHHTNWEFLDKTYYTHGTSCGKNYGLVLWTGSSFQHYELGGICGGNVTVTATLTCLVK